MRKNKNKDKVTKERKQISRKRAILNFVLVCIIGVGSGLFLGSWYTYSLATTPINYSKDATEFVDDINVAFKKATKLNNPTEDDIKNWVSIAKQNGVTPLNLTASENIMLAEYNLKNSNSYFVLGTGEVNVTIATQSIYSTKYFDGTTYLSENISKGTLTVADCFVMDKGSNTVTSIKGSDVTSTSANWQGSDRSDMTVAECKEKSGVTPDTVNPYIISSKTIISGGTIEEKVVDGKKVYSFSFNLDPINSVLNYIKQVKQTSGLTDYPEFDSITLTVVLDENWNFVEFNTLENYRVKFSGLKPKCTGKLNMKFTINEPVTLPKH